MDWGLLVLVVAFAVRGWISGMVSQLFAALGMLAGLWVAGWLSQWVGDHWHHARPAVFFLLLRLVVVLLSGLAVMSFFQWLGSLARQSVREGPLGLLDGSGGMILGAGIGSAFAAVLLMMALQLSWPPSLPVAAARARITMPLMKGAAQTCRYAGHMSPGWHWLRDRFLDAESRALKTRQRTEERGAA